MKQEINEYEFIRAFDEYGRSNNFSVEGRRALYDYLLGLEEETGQESELDVIALCCDYVEYSDAEEFAKDYGISTEAEAGTEEFKKEIEEEIEKNTTLIKFSDDLDDGFIIQAY